MHNKVGIYCLFVFQLLIVTVVFGESKKLSAEVEAALDKKQEVVSVLLANTILLEAIRESNAISKKLTQVEIEKKDTAWKESNGAGALVKPYLNSPCADVLVSFQDETEGFVEIFVTDERGLNVCQTNKTSDFYQADEDWWASTFASGLGQVGHGELEYDESAKSESIALYQPVLDPTSRKLIGVIKAVLDVTSIKNSI